MLKAFWQELSLLLYRDIGHLYAKLIPMGDLISRFGLSIKANYLNSCCKNIVDIFITVLMSKLKNSSQHWDKIMNVGAELLGWVCVFAVHWNMNLFRWLIFQWPTAKTVQQSKARAQPEYVVLFILCTVNVEYYVQSIVHCNVYCLQYWEYTV